MIFGQQSAALQACLVFQALHLLLWARERMMVIDAISLLLLRLLWSHISPKPLCWDSPQFLWWLEAQSDEGGASVRLADGAGENGMSIGHRSAEVVLRAQAEHSWTYHGHSEFTFPWLIWYIKAVAACKVGCKQQAAGGEIILPCGGCCKDWTWRLGPRDMWYWASDAAEVVILHIWCWYFWFQAASLHRLESVLKKLNLVAFQKKLIFHLQYGTSMLT